jgi:hypothetical protein
LPVRKPAGTLEGLQHRRLPTANNFPSQQARRHAGSPKLKVVFSLPHAGNFGEKSRLTAQVDLLLPVLF